MRLGQHCSDETKAKMSAAARGNKRSLGHHNSEETRAKMSVAQKGKPKPHKGVPHSDATKAKLSAINMGLKASPEMRANNSVAHWKGGPAVYRRKANAKRRVFGYVCLNATFAGCQGHHVDNEQVIFMPKELHRSIFHRQSDGRGMAQMNALAYAFMLEQNADVAIAGRALIL